DREQADERIENAEKQRVTRHGREIIDAFDQRVSDVRQRDLADCGVGGAFADPGDHMEVSHGPSPRLTGSKPSRWRCPMALPFSLTDALRQAVPVYIAFCRPMSWGPPHFNCV